MKGFGVETEARTQVIDVTDEVRAVVPEDATGVCTVFVKHTTAGIVVQENETNLVGDIEGFLDGLVPDEGHAHDRLDGNADSHLRATVLGPDVSIPVEDGELALGTWQSVLFVECDGPRRREVVVETVEG
jgi:secondary thiamine-phosphate synthase enzyme